jgi:hypothetical protein
MLEMMEVADREYSGDPPGLWDRLRPPTPFLEIGVPIQVYEHHVRELLSRDGRNLELGTEAEVMMALHAASLKAPLRSGPNALYHAIFRDVMGAGVHEVVLGGMEPPRFDWDDQRAELLHEMRPKAGAVRHG